MKRSDVFEVREPPPHGWTRLKARLEERRPARWPWAVVATGAVALIVLFALPRPGRIDPALQERCTGRARGNVDPGSNEPVTFAGDARGAVLRVSSQDAQVVMYRVAMLSATDEAPTE